MPLIGTWWAHNSLIWPHRLCEKGRGLSGFLIINCAKIGLCQIYSRLPEEPILQVPSKLTTMAEVDSGRNCPDGQISKPVEDFKSTPAFAELTHHQITKFIFFATTTRLPNPAPPPKLHYSTWWRKAARRLFQADHKRRVDNNRKLLLDRCVEKP